MSEIKNVPQLRFPQFTDDWKQTQLSQLGTFKNGLNKSKEDFGFGSPFINLMDVFGKSSINNKQYGLVNANEKELALYNLLKGDVVFIRSSVKREGVGETVLVTEDLQSTTYSGFLIRFRSSNNELNFLFKKYCFKIRSFRNTLISLSSTSANTNINQESLNTLKIKYPSLEEQQKIADFLSSVDKKIEQLTEKHRLLTEYKKGIMQQIFTQQIRFKDDIGNDYPEWNSSKFGDVFTRVTRKNKQNNLNVMTISAQQGLINQEKYFNKSVSASDVTGYYLLKKGEFAYNKSYSAGYPMGAIKRLNRYDEGCLSTLYICFEAKEKGLPEFFEQYFEAGMLNHEIKKIAQEGARNHGLLNISVVEFFRDIKIDFPCIEEQQKIANFLTKIDQKIDQAWSTLEQTKAFKKGLLQKMFV